MADSSTDPQETTEGTAHLPGSGEFSTPASIPVDDPVAADDEDALDDETLTDSPAADIVTGESEGPAPNPEAIRGDALMDDADEDGPLGER